MTAAYALTHCANPHPHRPPPHTHVGYWNIRGLAHPIRNLLAYLEVPYTEDVYELGGAPEYSREGWTSVKPTLPLEFPNLPYLFDGDVKLTQSCTILRYLARTHGAGKGLYEGTPAALAEVDLVLDQTVDMRTAVTRTAYGAMPFDTLRDTVLPAFLVGFEALFTRDGRTFAAGGSLTIADFALHEVLEEIVDMYADLAPTTPAFATYPAIAAYVARFEAVPAIAAYRARPDYIARPYNNKQAAWK